MDIGEFIRALRQELCYSQADLANAVGVTEQTVRRWEHNESFPHYAARRKLNHLCENTPLKMRIK